MSHTATQGPGAETDTWVRSTFRVLAEVPGVHRVGVALVEGGGRRLSFTASDRDPRADGQWCDIDAYDDVPLNNTVRTGRLIVGSLDQLAGRFPELVARQSSTTKALASAPLATAGQVMGGFALFYDSTQRFDDPQMDELRRLGETLGAELRRSQRATSLPSRSLMDVPVPPGALMTGLAISHDPLGVPAARHFARDALQTWGVDGELAQTALLCLSELVTNAIIHTQTGCEIRLLLNQGILTLSVRDGGAPVGRPSSSSDDPLAVHGRGLQLVEILSSRWGSELDAVGMTVWCELEVT